MIRFRSRPAHLWRALAGLAILPIALELSGCAAAAIGAGTAGAVKTAADRRSAGTILDDETIEYRVLETIGAEPGFEGVVHVNAVCINGWVLIAGEVPTQDMFVRAEELARAVPGVREIYNEVTVAPQSSMMSRTNDTVLTGKVKTALLGRSIEEGSRVKVLTERGTVYLMGLLTRAEADAATEIARNVAGVRRVVRIFEFVS